MSNNLNHLVPSLAGLPEGERIRIADLARQVEADLSDGVFNCTTADTASAKPVEPYDVHAMLERAQAMVSRQTPEERDALRLRTIAVHPSTADALKWTMPADPAHLVPGSMLGCIRIVEVVSMVPGMAELLDCNGELIKVIDLRAKDEAKP